MKTVQLFLEELEDRLVPYLATQYAPWTISWQPGWDPGIGESGGVASGRPRNTGKIGSQKCHFLGVRCLFGSNRKRVKSVQVQSSSTDI